MDEDFIKLIAQQLRKPEGEAGLKTASLMNQGNGAMNLKTIEHLNVSEGDNILEIGMGNGFFVRDILNVHSSVKYAGCDYSELMVEQSEKLNEKYLKEGRAQFYKTDAAKLPFKNETFNKLFTVNTIYFWEDPDAVMKEFCRVLKPGGILIITIRPKWYMESMPVAKYGFKMYSSEEVIEMMQNHNFKSILTEENEEPGIDLQGNEMITQSVVLKAAKFK